MSKRPHLVLIPTEQDPFDEETEQHGRTKRAARRASRPARKEGSSKDCSPPRASQAPRYVKNLVPRSEGQVRLIEALSGHDMILALGPAGTGKTKIAVHTAVDLLKAGAVSKIIMSRPAVEAGERLGFLPGDAKAKVDPYMRPLYDALHERMSPRDVSALIEAGVIEIAPIAFLRGRTLSNAVIIVDEAQNATRGQLKMVMTRLGAGSKMIITGDPHDQSDLEEGDSGLGPVADQVEGRHPGIAVVRLGEGDVVRHRIVRALLTLLKAA